MSHSLGIVYSLTGDTLGYFEYNGTCNFACGSIYDAEEMQTNWRGDNYRQCKCDGKNKTIVLLFTTYGNEFYWLAKVCMNCKAITDNLDSTNSLSGKPFQRG